MIAWPPRQHHEGPAGAVGFIEDREISEVTFHVLIPPFMCMMSVLDKEQCSTEGGTKLLGSCSDLIMISSMALRQHASPND